MFLFVCEVVMRDILTTPQVKGPVRMGMPFQASLSQWDYLMRFLEELVLNGECSYWTKEVWPTDDNTLAEPYTAYVYTGRDWDWQVIIKDSCTTLQVFEATLNCLNHTSYMQLVEQNGLFPSKGGRMDRACDPPDACETHGRCWTHSEWD